MLNNNNDFIQSDAGLYRLVGEIIRLTLIDLYKGSSKNRGEAIVFFTKNPIFKLSGLDLESFLVKYERENNVKHSIFEDKRTCEELGLNYSNHQKIIDSRNSYHQNTEERIKRIYRKHSY